MHTLLMKQVRESHSRHGLLSTGKPGLSPVKISVSEQVYILVLKQMTSVMPVPICLCTLIL